MGSLVAAALARAQAFLLEPAPASPLPSPPSAFGAPVRATVRDLKVAVVGLTPGCGSSTIARGLAIALGGQGARSAQLISVAADGDGNSGGWLADKTFAGGSRWEVPGGLDGDAIVEHASTIARVAGGPVAIVWDLASSEIGRARQAALEADAVVLVAGDRSKPALAQLVSCMLSERFGRVLLVATRVADPSRWRGRAIASVPESRLGAALLARGRRPAGGLGAALVQIASAVEDAR